jgi:hypothetical protein
VREVFLARFREGQDVITVNLHEATELRSEHGLWGAGAARPGSTGGVELERKFWATKDGVHVPHQQGRHAVQVKGADLELVLAAGNSE